MIEGYSILYLLFSFKHPLPWANSFDEKSLETSNVIYFLFKIIY